MTRKAIALKLQDRKNDQKAAWIAYSDMRTQTAKGIHAKIIQNEREK